MNTTFLSWSTGTSRGAETYGYTIVRLKDETTGKTFKCMGGGYDMQGTCFAEWLEATHAEQLDGIKGQAYLRYTKTPTLAVKNEDGLYGMHVSGSGKVRLDGGCGMSSMVRIAEALGLQVKQVRNGVFVTEA